jgi:hypothetical protein
MRTTWSSRADHRCGFRSAPGVPLAARPRGTAVARRGPIRPGDADGRAGGRVCARRPAFGATAPSGAVGSVSAARHRRRRPVRPGPDRRTAQPTPRSWRGSLISDWSPPPSALPSPGRFSGFRFWPAGSRLGISHCFVPSLTLMCPRCALGLVGRDRRARDIAVSPSRCSCCRLLLSSDRDRQTHWHLSGWTGRSGGQTALMHHAVLGHTGLIWADGRRLAGEGVPAEKVRCRG